METGSSSEFSFPPTSFQRVSREEVIAQYGEAALLEADEDARRRAEQVTTGTDIGPQDPDEVRRMVTDYIEKHRHSDPGIS